MPGSGCLQSQPSSPTHRRVASISWERETPRMVLVPIERAAARMARWAIDLLEGGVTVPVSLLGVMRTSMAATSLPLPG